MAKKRRVVYRTRGRRRGRGRGGFKFPKLMDIGQGIYNARELGAITAAKQAMGGDLEAAGNTIADNMMSIPTMVDLSFGNIIIGMNRKIVRWAGGRFVRKYIA